MATIRKRNHTYHVQIRKKGYPALTNSFKNRKTALAWAKKVESEIDRYIYLDISAAQKTTVSEVLDRYQEEILPTKRGRDQDSSRSSWQKSISWKQGQLVPNGLMTYAAVDLLVNLI